MQTHVMGCGGNWYYKYIQPAHCVTIIVQNFVFVKVLVDVSFHHVREGPSSIPPRELLLLSNTPHAASHCSSQSTMTELRGRLYLFVTYRGLNT